METEQAPAKLNLALHVTGRRADGYHLLDSLVAFAGVGDRVTVAAAGQLTLAVTGPMAAGLAADDDNLCLRAARAMGPGTAAITLDKHLPVASGIGGGSADAAATLRALARLWHRPLPADRGLSLGADVPVCLLSHPALMRGIGEAIEGVRLPPAHVVLVNPGVAVPTPAVFAALAQRDNPPLPPLPPLPDAAALAAWLRATRNDLEAPAIALAPAIADARAALAAQPGCLFARMSGSGATCFGLFAAAPTAQAAATALARPGWWIAAAPLGEGQVNNR
jgi:4-diphosphocytidyl-2-C-methyl-D-erythritol kinase